MTLNLSDEEVQALVWMLAQILPELRSEAYRTEALDLREELKRRELVLRGLRERLVENGEVSGPTLAPSARNASWN